MLVLASASPRRRALLDAMGLVHEVEPADVDETPRPGEDAAALVCRLAEAKARTVLDRRIAAVTEPTGLDGPEVLAADTVVVLDGRVMGKPLDADEAVAMLRALSGRTHEVLTGVAVARPVDDGTGVDVAVERTSVTFSTLTDAEILAYVATGEPLDKAGAYGIQGRAGAFVAGIEGSHDNVVGLPTARVAALLGVDGCTERGLPASVEPTAAAPEPRDAPVRSRAPGGRRSGRGGGGR